MSEDTSAPFPDDTAAFRDELRATWSPSYSGVVHFAFTSSVALAGIAYALTLIHAPTFRDWLTVPVTFLYANAVEYFGHKGPMHHRTPGVGLVFKRHTLEHHRFFTHVRMDFDTQRDVKMVLFPPVLIIFFFGIFALPSGLLLRALFGQNVAGLFVATAMAYFLSYEWLHFSYHLPADTFVGRLGIVKVLREHHLRHHEVAKMTKGNFNITFPVCDAIFGTTLK